MARTARVDIGGEIYHVINRAVGRLRIFDTQQDYQLFLDVLEEARQLTHMRILAFVVMPNHWHLVLYPRSDGDMGIFMHQLTNVHTRRVHAAKGTTGTGPLYQGRYKSFLVQDDHHLLTVIKYVERNPVRAKIAKRCEEWRWGSAQVRMRPQNAQDRFLDEWPVDMPKHYMQWINTNETEGALDTVRVSVKRGTPFGCNSWADAMVKRYELTSTVRGQGRPRKEEGNKK